MRRLRSFCLCFFLFLLAISFAYGEQAEIRVLHVNDFHGFVEPYKPLGSEELLGGIAYLAGRANALLKCKYSPSEKRGSRIKEISVAGKSVQVDREYIVATNDFMAVGGDGYKTFEEAIKSSKNFSIMGGMMKGEKVVYSDSSRWLRDVVVEFVKEKKKIAPKVEGRIVEVR